jgi:hypothetical protein
LYEVTVRTNRSIQLHVLTLAAKKAGSFFATWGKANLQAQRRYSRPVDRTTGFANSIPYIYRSNRINESSLSGCGHRIAASSGVAFD